MHADNRYFAALAVLLVVLASGRGCASAGGHAGHRSFSSCRLSRSPDRCKPPPTFEERANAVCNGMDGNVRQHLVAIFDSLPAHSEPDPELRRAEERDVIRPEVSAHTVQWREVLSVLSGLDPPAAKAKEFRRWQAMARAATSKFSVIRSVEDAALHRDDFDGADALASQLGLTACAG